MAVPTSNLSSHLAATVSVLSDSSKMEALPAAQVALATLQLNASPPETSNQNDSLISMFVKGMEIIQNQKMIIEKQSEKLQEQESEIEKLQAELKKCSKTPEQNLKKEEKLPMAVIKKPEKIPHFRANSMV